MALVETPSDELVALVGSLSSVHMDEYAVVGSYMRFGEGVREQLKDARVRIAEACAQPAKRRDNHLLWAAPGSGKTYFVEQVAASLPEIAYAELNLAKLAEADFREGLSQAIAGGSTICLIDEVDAKPEEPWPYEALMPFLDVNLDRGGGIVFVLAGSSGQTIEEFKDRIRARPKGTDVLSRVPEANGWEIAPMDAGDRILVALSQMLNAASELGRSLVEVEKLALHYLASAPHLANARQLREFAVRAVERGSASSDRIRYDDLFDSGEPENKSYWASVMPQAEALANSFVHIRDGSPSPPSSSPQQDTPLAHLPVPTTPFFGRESELAELNALLTREETRLVTLTGPGGIGKTRLALEAATRAAESFPDGVYWVGLASLRDVERVLPALAQALGMGAANELEAIGSALSGQKPLLALDNCEHLLPELASTIASLRDSTNVTILATSRERLQLTGERAYAVPGLSDAEGPELFVARAAAIGAAPTMDRAVAELCERLDQLPLAIELAAARSAALSPEQLLERLGLRLDLLKGARDADPRQMTLRATIEWSHDLLDDSERRLFRELSVFRSGCTLEAAEAVCRADLETLQSLLDKSLVRWRESGESHRYWMLETIRQFAREELEQADDLDRVRDAHARWYVSAADRWADESRRESPAALGWIGSEIDNLRAAVSTLLETELGDEAVTLAANISSYFHVAGAHREFIDLVERIEALEPTPSSGLVKLQRLAAVSAEVLGDGERSTAMLALAAATAEAAGDELERWRITFRQGQALYSQGDPEGGDALMHGALARLRDLEDNRGLASVLYTYGIALLAPSRGLERTRAGEGERALTLLTEALEISQNDGLEYGVAVCTQGLGWARSELGDHSVALALGAESAARFAEMGDREGASWGLSNCAAALMSLGDSRLAATLWAVSGRIHSELGIPKGSEEEEFRDLLEESLGPSSVVEIVAAAEALEEDEAIRLATEASRWHAQGASERPPSLP
jgi:predicted ATPase